MHLHLYENLTSKIVPRSKEQEKHQSSFKVGVNEMLLRSIHNDMSTGHAITGAGLLIPLEVNTIVTKYPSNQITNNNSNFIVEIII